MMLMRIGSSGSGHLSFSDRVLWMNRFISKRVLLPDKSILANIELVIS